jgi:hypothetical protein
MQAFAQYTFEGSARWWWESSSDGGASWLEGSRSVDQAAQSVLIRARLTYTQPPDAYFGFTYFDAVVYGAGAGDGVRSMGLGMLGSYPLAARRFGSTIKIDSDLDTDPPGVGPWWIRTGQASPQTFPTPLYDNPLTVFSYSLVLDGTLGDRVIDHIYRPIVNVPNDRNVFVYNLRTPCVLLAEQTTYAPMTIHVVPAPLGASLLACGLGTCMIRRRRP